MGCSYPSAFFSNIQDLTKCDSYQWCQSMFQRGKECRKRRLPLKLFSLRPCPPLSTQPNTITYPSLSPNSTQYRLSGPTPFCDFTTPLASSTRASNIAGVGCPRSHDSQQLGHGVRDKCVAFETRKQQVALIAPSTWHG
jgi:hypothetical protein